MRGKTGLKEGKKRCCWMEGQEKRKEAAHFTHMTAASQAANNSCHSAILLSPKEICTSSCHEEKSLATLQAVFTGSFLPFSLNTRLKTSITSIHWIWSLSMLSTLTVISAYPRHHLPPAKCARELQNYNDTFKYNVFKISLPSQLHLFTDKCLKIRIPVFSRKDVWLYSNSLQLVMR